MSCRREGGKQKQVPAMQRVNLGVLLASKSMDKGKKSDQEASIRREKQMASRMESAFTKRLNAGVSEGARPFAVPGREGSSITRWAASNYNRKKARLRRARLFRGGSGADSRRLRSSSKRSRKTGWTLNCQELLQEGGTSSTLNGTRTKPDRKNGVISSRQGRPWFGGGGGWCSLGNQKVRRSSAGARTAAWTAK